MQLAMLAMLATLAGLAGVAYLSYRRLQRANPGLVASIRARPSTDWFKASTWQGLANDVSASSDLMGGGLGMALTIIGAVVAVTIAALLAPTYITAVGNASSAIATTDTGNSTSNTLRGIFSLLVSLGGLIGIVVLVLAVIHLKKK